jgi:hypothetical protein
LAPQPQQRRLIIAQDNPSIRAANEVTAGIPLEKPIFLLSR